LLWPTLTVLAVIVAAAIHWWWWRRYLEAQAVAQFDIDALKERLQTEASQSEARQRAVFNSMTEGLLLLDHRSRVSWANEAFLKLFEIDGDIRGQTILEILRRHELEELLENVNAGALGRESQLHLNGPDERWLNVNAAVLHDSHGLPRGTILVFHDLTRIKQLERTREEFVANVSHELRTPLSLIRGYVETLLDGARENPELTTKFLGTIQRNAERLQFLIEDLLTISELESGRLTMSEQRLLLGSLVDKVIDDLRADASARGTTVLNEVPELLVHADPDRLQQVLGNLVGNALKYGRQGGLVKIGAEENQDEQVHVWVQDDGPGIPAEALSRVFERFYRVDKARSREAGGTGLGLSIVKHIVQSHGGTVWATSEPGKGATFHFTIPSHPPGPSITT